MNKTKTFMVAIMLALALTLATVGMTTLTQHAQAYDNPCGVPRSWANHNLPGCPEYNPPPYSDSNGGNYVQTYA